MKFSKVTLLTLVIASSLFINIASYGEHQKQIKIGVTTSSDTGLLRTETILQLAEEDIQQWINDNGYNVKIHFKLRNNNLDVDQAEKNTMIFDKSGYDVIVGHGQSSHCSAVLDYVNENDMLLLSPSSTSPLLSIPDDNLYRLITDDTVQGRVLAYYMAESGVKAVSVVYLDDAYGNGLREVFVSECANFGIDVISIHAVNLVHDFKTLLTEIDPILAGEASEMGYTPDQVALEMIMYSAQTEQAFDALLSDSWQIIDQITWYGCDGTADYTLADNYGEIAAQIKLICPVFAAQYSSPEHMALWERFMAITGLHMNAYDPITYDSLRIIAEAMVLAEDPHDIDCIKQALETVATDYHGVSGLINFNENGDRIGCDYDFWGFYEAEDGYHFWKYGIYNLIEDSIEIFDEPLP